MRKPHFFRICGLLLLSLIFCLPVWGQMTVVSQAPFTGGTLTSALSFSGTTHGGLTVLSLTTAQRDALTANVGTIIWNTTDSRYNFYNGSAWVTMVRTTGDTMTGALLFSPTGTVDIGSSSLRARSVYAAGGYTTNIVTKTSNYTATASDYTILVDTSGGSVTITFPSAASHPGRIYVVRKVGASNTMTVAATSGTEIDGLASIGYAADALVRVFQSDGTKWWIIGAKG